MKRIALCLCVVILLTGMYAENSGAATATVTLSNMTRAYTGSPLYPTATTIPASLPIIWTNAPKTAVGSYAVTARVGSNPGGYTGSKSGTFTIYRPGGGFGGGTIGGGSEGEVFVLQGLWSDPETEPPADTWFSPTFLCRDENAAVSLRSITILAPNMNAYDPMSIGTYILYPAGYPPDTSNGFPLSFGVPAVVNLEGSVASIFAWDDPQTWAEPGLNSCQSALQAAFGFHIPGTGIPVYMVPPEIAPDDLKIEFLFKVGDQDLSIVRTWSIDADSTPADFWVEETTPIPPPPIPQPDDLTVLSNESYTKICETRLLFGWWLYRYKLNLLNNGSAPLKNVCGQVKSISSSVKVVDPEVCFPDIPAGGSATSKGTFTFMAKSPNTSGLSWTYSSLKITAKPSAAMSEQGTYPVTHYVTLSTSAPKTYYVLFHQWIPEGVAVTPDAPLGWSTSEAKTWSVTQDITVPEGLASEIRAKAWLLNTLQEAEVTVPIDTMP